MNCQLFLAIGKNRAEKPPRRGAAQEVLLIGRFIVGVAGRKHHALVAKLHHFIEVRAHAVGIGAVKQRCVGRNPEAAFDGFLDAFDLPDRSRVPSRQTEKSWCSRCPSTWTENVKYLLGLKRCSFFFKQEGVGAEIDVFLALDQAAYDDFVDLRVHQRLAAGDGNHRRAGTRPQP